MSSTSSSELGLLSESSAAGALARRYRHLFVLPSLGRLLVYSGVASAVVAAAVASSVQTLLATFVGSLGAAVFSAWVVAWSASTVEPDTIATPRRALAMVFAGEALWLLCLAAGFAYSLAVPGTGAVLTSLFYGSFLVAGFELMVVRGAFTGRPTLSVAVSVVHPLGAALVVGYVVGWPHNGYAVVLAGAAAYAVLAGFVVRLGAVRTSRGTSATRLFRAFMKTWAGGRTADLERAISEHSREVSTSTAVVRFSGPHGKTFLVMPGVHPGPFYPIGSYNLPGLIFEKFRAAGLAITLHRPGGHERNLATNAETTRFVDLVYGFAVDSLGRAEPAVRGPFVTKVDQATVTSVAFSSDSISTISFSPMGSDDLETRVERDLKATADGFGLKATVVDAHNSIAPEMGHAELSDDAWASMFRALSEAQPSGFRVGSANSEELHTPAHEDITTAGVSVLLIQVREEKWVLVLADANNAVAALRGRVADSLRAAGYKLFELCTSDSHNLAARGLTVTRGYQALGESTPPEEICGIVLDLARLAESRLDDCEYSSGELTSNVSMFGVDALNEFAAITQSSSRFA